MVVRVAQGVQEQVAGRFQGPVRLAEEAEEGGQACVDGLVAGFDQAIGVQDELVTGVQSDARGAEGNPTDAEGTPVGRSSSSGARPGRTRTGGRCPARAMRQCARCGS